MAGTFDQRARELAEAVGDGKLTATLTFDQIYALAIHSGFWRTGPLMGVTNRPRHGGETGWIVKSLVRNRERYLRNLAHAALEPGGPEAAMVECVEDWNRAAQAITPRESGALSHSGHPVVRSGTATIYNRPPIVRRLTKEELRRRHDFVPRRHFGAGR